MEKSYKKGLVLAVELTSPFHFPLLIEIVEEGDRIADEFCLLAKSLRSKDKAGGLLSHSWGMALQSGNKADYEKDGYTSFYNQNLAEKEEFNEIHQVAVKQIEKYLAATTPHEVTFGLTNSWASIYGKGHFVPDHIHPMAHLSVVFYAAATEGTGEISFKNPAYSAYAMSYGDKGLFRDTLIVQPKKGMMIVFPSFLEHGTRPHEDHAERIIFSTNAVLEFV